jgi:hypothetical protein
VGGLIKGVFSTAKGLYNMHKLKKLKDLLQDVQVQLTQLVWITLDTCPKLNQTAKLTNLLKNQYSHSTLADPAYTLSKLGICQHKLDNDVLKTARCTAFTWT